MYKRENGFIVLIYIVLGLFMFFMIPRANEIYDEMYSDWYINSLLKVRAFHLPGYIWILPFIIVAFITLVLGVKYDGIKLRIINVIAFVMFVVSLVAIINWHTGFIFCHEWGCSSMSGY